MTFSVKGQVANILGSVDHSVCQKNVTLPSIPITLFKEKKKKKMAKADFTTLNM